MRRPCINPTGLLTKDNGRDGIVPRSHTWLGRASGRKTYIRPSADDEKDW